MNQFYRMLVRRTPLLRSPLQAAMRSVAVYRFSVAKDENDNTDPDFAPKTKPAPQIRASAEIQQQIDQIVKGNKVVLFMKGVPQSPQCGYSNYAVEVLKFYQVKDYHSVDVLKDQQLRDEIKVYSNWPTFPQLYVNGQLVGGCDIMTEMHKDGSLKELLATLK